jgi:nucleoside-diphosphate-sugar epimerase
MNFAKLTKGVVARVGIDVLLVNVCLFYSIALAATIQAVMANKSIVTAIVALFESIKTYELTGVLLTAICITAFSLSGFYGQGRSYRGRFKALIILQAVSVSYLILGFVMGYSPKGTQILPFNTLALAWSITVTAVLLSRLWSEFWRTLFVSEVTKNQRRFITDEKCVLVIGGAGYIGSALLPKLLNQGYKVRLLDLFIYGDEPIKEFMKHPRLEIIKTDFRQVDKIVEAVKGVSSVIHLGAIVGDPACALNEELTIEVNLMATKMIAEVCKGLRVSKFIFASTCSVYGASDNVLNERSKLNPVSLYAKTKIACENVLRQMSNDDFAPVILRFSTIFGLSGRTRFDLVANLLTAKACFDKKITVFGGDQWRPFLHVDDAAESVFCALKAPMNKVNNEVFNVGGDKLNYTLGQLGETIAAKVPDAELMEMGQDGDRRNYRVSFTKISRDLGFVPKWSLSDGIEQVLAAIQAGHVKNYEGSEFSNAKFLQENCIDSYMSSRYYYNVPELVAS